ncbi:MAG: M24 family metallopeptidase [Terriglobia bacterium]
MPNMLDAQHFRNRQEALREALAAKRLPALLVTKPENIFYLTGFRGSAGAAIWSQSDAVLWVDPRYGLQAQEQACGVDVITVKGGIFLAVGKWLRQRRHRRAGFEDEHLTFSGFEKLRGESRGSVPWQPASGMIEDLRVVKDGLEIEWIRKACQLTSEVFDEVVQHLKPGVSEMDLASELEYRMRGRGAGGMAFETIIASGARSALPHARPSAKLLRAAEWVIFDLGAMAGGYMADMTRTLFLGTPGRKERSLYRAVFEAQRAAIHSLRPGVKAGAVDEAARGALRARGLEKLFVHSTGHGVGLEIHERPRLGRTEKKQIPAGSVVTIEPGVYIEGMGGIRIEDTILVTGNGAEILTSAATDHWYTS